MPTWEGATACRPAPGTQGKQLSLTHTPTRLHRPSMGTEGLPPLGTPLVGSPLRIPPLSHPGGVEWPFSAPAPRAQPLRGSAEATSSPASPSRVAAAVAAAAAAAATTQPAPAPVADGPAHAADSIGMAAPPLPRRAWAAAAAAAPSSAAPSVSTVPWDLDPRLHPLPENATLQQASGAEGGKKEEGASPSPPQSFLEVLDSASQGLAAAALPSPDLLEALGELPSAMRGSSLVQSFGQISQDFTTQAQALVLASQMEQHLALLAQVAAWTEADTSVRHRPQWGNSCAISPNPPPLHLVQEGAAATRELCWGMLGHVAQERESAVARRARATVMVPCEEPSPLVRRLARDPLMVGRATRRVTRQLLRCALSHTCPSRSLLHPVCDTARPASARGRPSLRRLGAARPLPGASRARSSTRRCSPPPSAPCRGGGEGRLAGAAPS